MCSDSRFKRLFRAVDINGDATISLEDFGLIIFPDISRFEDVVQREQVVANQVSNFNEDEEDEEKDSDDGVSELRSPAPSYGNVSVL
jgi:hypothetical protein